MEQAEVEQRIIKECLRSGLPLPDKIQNAPRLQLGLELYYDAFWELSSCRNVGWTVGPIPWSVVNDYAVAFEFSEDQREALFHYLRAMDRVYMDKVNPKPKKKGQQKWDRSNSQGAWPTSRKV